ncbi:hypothetical protein BVG16_21440 [Paenibacillus selenitireducens]|uniref:Terminase small subunit n=1 Tax=Paenibacillus selenitireducens TaxID=1324314 RepID=A0A1T2X5Q5_9BACL|nr:terminase small subunit [Paenibacillus selenitireducens]OPA75172.1 hypothetical protein BVG16_21440 [Paenibacillus selenitireducens]
MKTTPRQRAFADYYIETGNAKESYIRAGYISTGNAAEAGAVQILRNIKVNSYIAERMESKDKERIDSQDEILETLTRILRGEEYEEIPIGIVGGAQMLTPKPPSTKERLDAAEKLGKRYGLWKDVIDVTHKLPTFVNDVPEDDDS